jgi:hypothetical protein
MRTFDYYVTTNEKQFNHCDKMSYIKSQTDKINEAKLTSKEREDSLKNLPKESKKWLDTANFPHTNRLKELNEEFWQDCREDLGYEKFLNEDGVNALEGRAWDEGHSCGYANVYSCLEDLVEFVSCIIKTQRD